MTAGTPTADGPVATRPFDRVLPPVVPVAMAALALAVSGGVIVAAGAAMNPSLVLPTVLVVGAIVLELAAVVMSLLIRPFAWGRFVQVFLWALLAYAVQSGMIVFAFVQNEIPAGPLAVLSLGLVVFATDVPFMIAFTVARYEQVAD